MREIVQQGHPALRSVADFITPEEISSPWVQELIADMHHALATQKDGVALAAPQVGEALQMFIVAPEIFEKPEHHPLVYINPEIISTSQEKDWLDEGCLSCRWKVGQVERSIKVTIRAYDEKGNLFEEEAYGLLAHIFQHETDHLRGILFLDKARGLREMTEKEIKESQE